MAQTRDPKGCYYRDRDRYMRITRCVGHKLELATTEENDALLWEKYSRVLQKWRKLEKPEGVRHRDDLALRRERYLRPEFNEDYVALTEEIALLYQEKDRAKSRTERAAIDEKIHALKQKRRTVTNYYDRETGERVAI